jgi:macrolide transport system ATP-binding/permease protein
VSLFSRQAFLLTAGGIVLGLGAHVTASVYLRRILYDLKPWEPTALVSVVFLVGVIAASATLPATYRAVRVDLSSALRAE